MALSLQQIVARVEGLKVRYADKDKRNGIVARVRRGDVQSLMPTAFSDEWPAPIVANLIDTGARDLSEVTGVLPAINCSTSKMSNDAAKKRADLRTQIVNWYVEQSRLGTELVVAADRYYTYGLAAIRVEPNTVEDRPQLTVEDTYNGYPEYDRWGNCVAYAKRFNLRAAQIVSQFPEAYAFLSGDPLYGGAAGHNWSERLVELVRYDDENTSLLYCYHPQANDKSLVLATWANPVGRCLVVPIQRPSVDGHVRGQFDDVIYPYLAKHRTAMLNLQATHKAVTAPIVGPTDMQNIPFGPNAVMRTREPQNVRRLGIDIPAGIFAQDKVLEQEIRNGMRYPESRSGNLDASVITGRGVDALQGGFDTQVKMAQEVFASGLTRALQLAFELDEKMWPNKVRPIRGMQAGAPFEVTYTPAEDIKGDYTVDVTYGLLAGMDPNRSLIWILQALQAGLISHEFAMRNLPANMNVTEEEKLIDIEKMRAALLEALVASAQGIPQMMATGQDPTQLVSAMATAVKDRRDNKNIEDAILDAFAPKSPPPGAPMAPGSEQPPPPTGAPGALAPSPGGGIIPQARPPLSQLIARLGTSGKATLSGQVVQSSQ